MVDEDGGCLVGIIGGLALELHYETWLSRDHLINGNNLPCRGHLEHLFACVAAFCSPWQLGHSTKEATSTLQRHHFCQLLWCLANFCQFF